MLLIRAPFCVLLIFVDMCSISSVCTSTLVTVKRRLLIGRFHERAGTGTACRQVKQRPIAVEKLRTRLTETAQLGRQLPENVRQFWHFPTFFRH